VWGQNLETTTQKKSHKIGNKTAITKLDGKKLWNHCRSKWSCKSSVVWSASRNFMQIFPWVTFQCDKCWMNPKPPGNNIGRKLCPDFFRPHISYGFGLVPAPGMVCQPTSCIRKSTRDGVHTASGSSWCLGSFRAPQRRQAAHQGRRSGWRGPANIVGGSNTMTTQIS